MGKKADFDKIQQLIESGDKSNINLAFVLAEAKGIHKSKLIKPWLEILNFLHKKTNIKLNLNTDLESVLSNAVAIKSISCSDFRSLPKNILKLKFLEEITILSDFFNKEDYFRSELNNLSSLKKLSLYNIKIPSKLSLPESLEYLVFSNNKLLAIPEELQKLKKLQTLRIENNQLNQIPEFLSKFSALEKLSFESNHISKIPDSFTALTKLKTLLLRNNPITDIGVLVGLKNLEELFLDACRIREVPAEIFNLPALSMLSLQNNQKIKIAELKGVSNLKILGLGSMNSMEMSDLNEFPPAILNLKNLEKLSITSTQISCIPEEIGNLSNLSYLNLSLNNIRTLPESISNLKNLKSLFLKGNGIDDAERKKISALLPGTTIHY